MFVCLATGCTSVRIPTIQASKGPERVCINMEGCAWDLPDAASSAELQAKFAEALGAMVQISNIKDDLATIKITSLRIAGAPRAGVVGPIFISIFSTPIVPLLFIRNRCTADLSVTYTAADQTGKPGEQRQLKAVLRGSFGGWSFIRFAFRGKVKSHLEEALPRVAAELVAADLNARSIMIPKPAAEKPPKT